MMMGMITKVKVELVDGEVIEYIDDSNKDIKDVCEFFMKNMNKNKSIYIHRIKNGIREGFVFNCRNIKKVHVRRELI